MDGTERLNQSPFSGLWILLRIHLCPLGMGRIFSDQWGDFNGSIDDFRIYSVEVNASQVAVLYNSGTGDFASGESTR